MISLSELNPHNYPTDGTIGSNLSILLARINAIRQAYGIPMTVTSGLRSVADQMRINPSAPHSHHITGEAVDIADADGKVYDWCKANEDLLANTGLWLEERMGGWQHFQIVPPKSGHRWFFP